MRIENQGDIKRLQDAIHKASQASDLKRFWDELYSQVSKRMINNFANDEKLDTGNLIYYKAYMKALYDIDKFLKASIVNGKKAETALFKDAQEKVQKEHIDDTF